MTTLGSLFDGIGSFPLAAQRCGIKTVWASEIDTYAILVTKRHFPNMKHLGDIIKINGAEIAPVDIITFGSPCQDLSIAGKRAGLDGERSGLFGEAIRIINEMRNATNGKYPSWVIWENVSGVLSSNNGLDFRAVIQSFIDTEIPMPNSGRWANAGLVRIGRCDLAWRILDAQYFGVPQRRRRIFLVADFAGERAAEILFKPESLRGDFAESGKARERITGNVGGGTGGASVFDCRGHGDGRIACTLTGDHQNRVTDYTAIIVSKYSVRRLTPLECERLMGYPDGWTGGLSDTQRYKTLGNSIAVPCAEYILEGIARRIIIENN